jgi:hypothetical protein
MRWETIILIKKKHESLKLVEDADDLDDTGIDDEVGDKLVG